MLSKISENMQEMRDAYFELSKDYKELQKINSELLYALELYMKSGHGNRTHYGDQAAAYSAACRAMEKAKGSNHV